MANSTGGYPSYIFPVSLFRAPFVSLLTWNNESYLDGGLYYDYRGDYNGVYTMIMGAILMVFSITKLPEKEIAGIII